MGRTSAIISVVLVLLAAGSASGQGDAAADVRVQRARDFGYFTGDLVELGASVRVPRSFALDARTLAEAAQPAWLEARETSWKVQEFPDALSYEFRFVFQVFYAPDRVARLAVPDRRLVFRSEETGERLEALIPAFHFSLSPLTDSTSAMEPDWQVPPPSTRWIKLSAGSLAALLGLLGASVAVERRRHRRRVFWQAHRKVYRARDCTEALLVLHRALEEQAGKALFAGDLDALTDRWAPADAMRDDLEHFFELSDALFYGNHGDGGPEESTDCLRWLQEFSGRLMALERRFGDGQPAARKAGRR